MWKGETEVLNSDSCQCCLCFLQRSVVHRLPRPCRDAFRQAAARASLRRGRERTRHVCGSQNERNCKAALEPAILPRHARLVALLFGPMHISKQCCKPRQSKRLPSERNVKDKVMMTV